MEDKFDRISRRLQILEHYYELAVTPTDIERADYLTASDIEAIECNTGLDLAKLQEYILNVRRLRNLMVPPMLATVYDACLVPKPSQILKAGMGLYYECDSSIVHTQTIPAGAIICYYSGDLHNYQSAKTIADRSYLIALQVQNVDAIDSLVNAPNSMPSVKAHYINDAICCNTSGGCGANCLYNCAYKSDPSGRSAQVVALREIKPGEELFASYGEAYWTQHASVPNRRKV